MTLTDPIVMMELQAIAWWWEYYRNPAEAKFGFACEKVISIINDNYRTQLKYDMKKMNTKMIQLCQNTSSQSKPLCVWEMLQKSEGQILCQF